MLGPSHGPKRRLDSPAAVANSAIVFGLSRLGHVIGGQRAPGLLLIVLLEQCTSRSVPDLSRMVSPASSG
jgi:hypothetical protein